MVRGGQSCSWMMGQGNSRHMDWVIELLLLTRNQRDQTVALVFCDTDCKVHIVDTIGE